MANLKYIVVALSLLAGAVVYHFLEFSAATLVMEVKTFEHGTRKLAVTGYDGKEYTRTFALNGKWGIVSSEPGKRMYVVELPATKIMAIKIEPLAVPGAFEIDRITLSDDITSYTWDEQGACSRKTWRPAVDTYKSCSDGAPSLKTSPDGAILIESIRDIGRRNSVAMRATIAMILSIGGVFCVWLLWNRYASVQSPWNRLGIVSVCLAVMAGYSYQLFLVCTYSMDAPYFDEWDYFDLNGKLCIPDTLSTTWLFDFWSEHIIVPTKLMIWLNLKLFSLNLEYDKICNYIIYGLLLVAILVVKEKITGKGVFPYFPAFIMFLLSPVAHENHLWGFQSQTHFFLLLSIIPLYVAYRKPPTYTTAAFFYLLLLTNIFTFGAGVVVSVVYMICYGAHIVCGIGRKHIKAAQGWNIIIAGVVAMTPCLYFRFHGYAKAGWTPSTMSPLTSDFWAYFSNILSLGIGCTTINVMPGIIWSVVMVLPMVRLMVHTKTRWEPSTWSLVTAILGVVAVLAAISYGRGGFNEPKTSRYAEYGLVLIPLVALAWWLALESARSRLLVLSALWGTLFICFSDTWSAQPYREKKQMDIFHLGCIESYFGGTGDGVCQGDKRGLNRAAQLGVSFTKQFLTSKPKPDGGAGK